MSSYRELATQKQQMLDALGVIAERSSDQWARKIAKHTIASVQPPCDFGLFGNTRQMDLQDRKDLLTNATD